MARLYWVRQTATHCAATTTKLGTSLSVLTTLWSCLKPKICVFFFFLLPLYYNSDWGRGLRCFLLFPKALPQYAKSNAVRHPKVLKQLLTPWNRNCAEAMEEVFSCVTARLCQIIILINNCNC